MLGLLPCRASVLTNPTMMGDARHIPAKQRGLWSGYHRRNGGVVNKEDVMRDHGDDASQCSNGLTASRYQAATTEERAVYRRWIRGAMAFYGSIAIAVFLVAIVSYSSVTQPRIAALATRASIHAPDTK